MPIKRLTSSLKKKNFILIFCATFITQSALAKNPTEPTQFKILSGDKKGSFYAVADSLCKVFNFHHLRDGYQCTALESKGSESNLKSLAAGEADLGIVKTPQFNKFFVKHFSSLENKIDFVTKIHDEYLTILVPKNLKIKSLNDLNNRVVNIGSNGSTSALIAQKYFSDFEIKPEKIVNFGATKSFEFMCNKKIDAWVYFIGHPNDGFLEALNKCDLELITLSTQESANFLKTAPFLREGFIDKELYKLTQNIETISSETILAARKEIDPKIVMLVQDVFLNHKHDLIAENTIFKGF